tara:strand:- start:55 stop:276 length:222 start_codon:yes stop_codon:yes gene_type:complete
MASVFEICNLKPVNNSLLKYEFTSSVKNFINNRIDIVTTLISDKISNWFGFLYKNIVIPMTKKADRKLIKFFI